MKVYRYRTKISHKGTIKIPLDPALYNKEVDVIILQKEDIKEKEFTAKEFVEKWTGFLHHKDTDKSKYGYLSDKYK